ncbi:MFS transporter [Rhodobacterales bacterium HKCCE4037]|nr:MFS transporter [Rhodobacterales bacterium HKCCE4037]
MTERFRITAMLGVVQILTWGSSFYLLAVLAGPIVEATGWPAEAVAGGLSVALVVSGLSAPVVGRNIAERGGRVVMGTGVVILICGLLAMAAAPSLPFYLMAWAVMGAGMAATLYEAAFSTIGTIMKEGARGAITRLTLWGGFASTVCWPLSAWMAESFGWRGTCLGYVAVHLLVTLPLIGWGLPRGERAIRTTRPERLGFDLKLALMILIAVSLTLVFTTVSVQLITLLTASGLTLAAAVALGTLIGPAQVGARVLEMAGRERHSPLLTLLVSGTLIITGLIGLWAGLPPAAALIAYGSGTGLYSIARGTVPLALFGPEIYPQAMASVARPAMIAAACAPVTGAWLIGQVGPQGTLLVLVALAALACGGALVLGAITRRSA